MIRIVYQLLLGFELQCQTFLSYQLDDQINYNLLCTLPELINKNGMSFNRNSLIRYNKIQRLQKKMYGASPFTLLKRQKVKKEQKQKKTQPKANFLDMLEQQSPLELEVPYLDSDSDNSSICQDLNVFVLTFEKMKQAQKNLAGGDPYQCKFCYAYLNSYSKIITYNQLKLLKQSQIPHNIQLKPHESLWVCEFCDQSNILNIEKQEVPKKDDIVYMIESELQKQNESKKDETMVFCIDVSGSMNTTTEIQGKVDLKFGMSQQELDMLRQFMEPGDQAQLNWMPGQHNQNKTFVSRKQCILSAIESQLQEIKKNDPLKRVGFVTFNNEVTILGDKFTNTVNIVGDKLYNKNNILQSLENFQLKQPLSDSFENLINNLNKTQAKGQTALGPALIAAIEIASKGTPGSSIYLCTDGLANIGLGALQNLNEENKKIYEELAQVAKARNLSVNIMTIKGEGCKMQVIGKIAQSTHGNMKVVNPQKLAEDFANVLKDEVVGVSVKITIMLHRAIEFRKENKENLKKDGSVLLKEMPIATVNSKISFEYQLKNDEDLQKLKVNLEKLKEIPFQAQIQYINPKGGKFLRVISSQTKGTQAQQDLKQEANLGVVHQRVTAQTAALYSKGQKQKSSKFNQKWTNFLSENFKSKQYARKQNKFMEKNTRLQKAIKHKIQKEYKPKKEEQIEEQDFNDFNESALNRSLVDSDSDEAELKDNLMEKQNYSFVASDIEDQEESQVKPEKKK